MVGPKEAIIRVVAKAAWFTFGSAFIKRLCAHEGCELEECNSLLEVLVAATMKVLDISEKLALDICYARIARLKARASYSKQLLQVDEAVEVMDRNDVSAFKKQQEHAKTDQDELKSLATAYVARKSAVVAAVAKKEGKVKQPKGAKKKPPLSLPADLSSIPHSDIKQYVPHDGRVWKSTHAKGWIGHVPPNETVDRAWAKYGEIESLRLVLVAVWQQHCDKHAIAYALCPLKGVLDSRESLAGAVGSSGGASSSI